MIKGDRTIFLWQTWRHDHWLMIKGDKTIFLWKSWRHDHWLMILSDRTSYMSRSEDLWLELGYFLISSNFQNVEFHVMTGELQYQSRCIMFRNIWTLCLESFIFSVH
ncbi:hypothetical protein AVEN_34440-1 [Araneus ventricosus]|uniref:Uncharacterized protein n=1 Tax=Araneus ventricosus TaxID=182803 RepID=A0A4Y2GW50_ARAVE|nr:hypothetical protein AVEN_34440-1 [Araneus ventricosus]